VGLIHEAHLRRDVGERLAAQDPIPGRVESAAGHVPMRRDAEGVAEAA